MFKIQHSDPAVLYPDFLSKSDYYDTDSHINALGSLKVISNVLNEFGYPNLPEPDLDDVLFHADLTRMMGDDKKEKVKKFKGFTGLPKSLLGKGNPIFESYTLNHALGSNTGALIFRFNPYALFNRRIILFGDSFFSNRLDVYQNIFSEVVFFRVPYILEDVVKALEPDIVLTGNTERYLYNVPNSNKPRPWFMNYISKKYDTNKISERDREGLNSLFSGKDSSSYKKKFGSRLTNLPRDPSKLVNLNESHIKNNADFRFIRDMAINLQETDIGAAYYLLTLAHTVRPDGPFTKKKMIQFRNESYSK